MEACVRSGSDNAKVLLFVSYDIWEDRWETFLEWLLQRLVLVFHFCSFCWSLCSVLAHGTIPVCDQERPAHHPLAQQLTIQSTSFRNGPGWDCAKRPRAKRDLKGHLLQPPAQSWSSTSGHKQMMPEQRSYSLCLNNTKGWTAVSEPAIPHSLSYISLPCIFFLALCFPLVPRGKRISS